MTVLLARVLSRLAIASIALSLAGTLIYGFGAGYFWPIGLPTPLNAFATVILTIVVLRWACRYVSSAWRNAPTRTDTA